MTSPQATMPPPARKIRLCVFAFLLAMPATVLLQARENPVNAIVLFDGASGAAYVQVAGLTVNGKSELRVCDGVPTISKMVFDGLPKAQLGGATALERNSDGTLMLTVNAKSMCVVPGNLKFDKSAELTPAEAADQAVLQGAIVSSSGQTTELPQVKRGVRLVIVAAADEDLAQYLLAARANSVAGWQDFLSRHGSSAHVADARNALAAIYEGAAESAFAQYEKSTAGQEADVAALRKAQDQAAQANEVIAGYPAAAKLRAQISKELDTLMQPDAAKLKTFRQALAEHTAGFSQLAAARHDIDELLAVKPDYAPVQNLHSEITAEVHKLESTVQQAEGLAASKDYDQALQVLGPYRAFASEAPRIGAITTAAYNSHFQHGRQMAAEHNWEKAVVEFRRAAEINHTAEVSSELKDAEAQWAITRDRRAAQEAVARSQEYAANKDFIGAYETLAELPDRQRALVTDQLAALQKDFVPAALRRAQKLQEIHMPIRGRADEEAIQEAYELLDRGGSLTGDPAIKLKLDLLSDKVSAYYVDRAQRYLGKPMGSGVGIGWLYLTEAAHYKPNLGSVKDAMSQYAAAYQLRSRLSVGVMLRDQTSRRDSVGFADQLTDAIANGLEASGLSIKVVRHPKEGTDVVQPSFLLVGEILAHRVVKDAGLETLPSKYRAGTHDVKNEEWSQANDAYSAAQQALQTAQRTLADAHSKKDTAAANDAVATAQKNLDDARHKLDSTEPTRPQAVIEPYNYSKKNIDLTATIELNFHINDAEGNAVEAGTPIKKDNHKRFIVLENVKPEDTEGVRNQGTEPDQDQFLTDVEIQARDLLVQSVRDKVTALPAKILEQARKKAQQNDVDGAAEQYIVYLNTTTDPAAPERMEAAKFLHEHYNVNIPGLDGGQKGLAEDANLGNPK